MQYNIRYTLDYQLLNNFNDLNKYLINSDYFDSTDEEIKIKYKKEMMELKLNKNLIILDFIYLIFLLEKLLKLFQVNIL